MGYCVPAHCTLITGASFEVLLPESKDATHAAGPTPSTLHSPGFTTLNRHCPANAFHPHFHPGSQWHSPTKA
eukprot:1161050-Pelagomonas_calceolata.AAC.5